MADLKTVSYSSLAIFQSSDLNSLASGSYAFGSDTNVTSNALDNTSNLYAECALLLKLGSFNPSGSPYILFSYFTSPNATDYEDPQSVGVPQAGTPIWTHACSTGASAKVIVIAGIRLPPFKIKPVIGNLTGTTFASSANSGILVPTGYKFV